MIISSVQQRQNMVFPGLSYEIVIYYKITIDIVFSARL
jgi:hypothetical protein